MLPQQNGKILAGGNFTRFNGFSKPLLVRLNSDGSVDNSFTFNAFSTVKGTFAGTSALALQTDGKIIAGFQNVYNNLTQSYNRVKLVRLNADGSVDSSFNTDFYQYMGYSLINSVRILFNGKILVAGYFDVNNSSGRNLVRLNSDGSIDETFNVGGSGPNSTVYSMNVLSDNKIIITGDFDSYNGSASNILARLNSDGTLDESYKPVILDTIDNLNLIINTNSIADSNNKVTLTYLYYTDSVFGRVIRYNADGTIDSAFGINNKTDYQVSDLAYQDQKLLLSGYISSFNGKLHNRIMRIATPDILPVTWISVDATIKNIADAEVTWQTANELSIKNYNVQRGIDGIHFSNIATVSTKKGNGGKYVYLDINALSAAGNVYYRISETDNDGKTSLSKIVKVEDQGNQITIYPNPATDVLHINNLEAVSTITVLNALGKPVSTFLSNSFMYDLNIKHFSKGVYYIKISRGNYTSIHKFLKQ